MGNCPYGNLPISLYFEISDLIKTVVISLESGEFCSNKYKDQTVAFLKEINTVSDSNFKIASSEIVSLFVEISFQKEVLTISDFETFLMDFSNPVSLLGEDIKRIFIGIPIPYI